MMKRYLSSLAVLTLFACAASFNAFAQQSAQPAKEQSKQMESCPMHAEHMKAAAVKKGQAEHDHHAAVNERGDKEMGFSHLKTSHHFRLSEDGGAIEVVTNDAQDTEGLAQIRGHLAEIAKLFTAGDFTLPQRIHAQTPPGVPELKQLKAQITYRYEDTESGGRVRITTSSQQARDAVHNFLRFQISDHQTGDSGKVEKI